MVFALAFFGAVAASSKVVEYPVINPMARVKQHRAGANGDLVKGEEVHRKVILKWDRWGGAKTYEVCHNCQIDDATGVRSGDRGKVMSSGPDLECGSQPCQIFPGLAKGQHIYNLRVEDASGWSRWSPHVNFKVDESGFQEHKRAEL